MKEKKRKKKQRQVTYQAKILLGQLENTSSENIQLKEKAFLRKINQIFGSHYTEQNKQSNIEEINLDASILSDGYKEIKYL